MYKSTELSYEDFNKKIQDLINSYTDDDMTYQKYFIDWLISYIHKNDSMDIAELEKNICTFPSKFVESIAMPNICDFYLDKTKDFILKNKNILETHVETFLKKPRILYKDDEYAKSYSTNISNNIQHYIEHLLKDYIFSDKFSTITLYNDLTTKYLNGCNDKDFVHTLTNVIYDYTNSDVNRYFLNFLKKVKNNPNILSNLFIKKYNNYIKFSDEKYLDNIKYRELSINQSLDNILYTNDELKNADIFLKSNILPAIPSSVLPRLYSCIKEDTNKAKDISTELFRNLLDNVKLEDFSNFATYKHKLCFRIKNIVNFLNELGLLEIYNNNNNHRLNLLGINELKFTKEDLLDSLTDTNKLSSYSLESLLGLSTFYTNRATKSASELCKSIYILRKLNLFENIANNKSFNINNINCSDDKLKELMAQYDFFINDVKTNIVKQYSTNEDFDTEQVILAYEKLYKKNKKAYENKYPGCYEDDYKLITQTIDSVEDCLYMFKDQTLKTLIYTAIKDNKKNIINWGYIHEYNSKDKNKILLGFDIQSLNMPIKVHVDKKQLSLFIKELTNNSLIPCYIGNEAMHSRIGKISTQVLNVVSKDKKKEILKNTKTRSMFFEHIKWIQKPVNKPKYYQDIEEKFYNIDTDSIISNKQIKNR